MVRAVRCPPAVLAVLKKTNNNNNNKQFNYLLVKWDVSLQRPVHEPWPRRWRPDGTLARSLHLGRFTILHTLKHKQFCVKWATGATSSFFFFRSNTNPCLSARMFHSSYFSGWGAFQRPGGAISYQERWTWGSDLIQAHDSPNWFYSTIHAELYLIDHSACATKRWQ